MIGFDLDGTVDTLKFQGWNKFPEENEGVIISGRMKEHSQQVSDRLKELELPNYKFYSASICEFPNDTFVAAGKAYYIQQLELTEFYEDNLYIILLIKEILKHEKSILDNPFNTDLFHITSNGPIRV